MKKLAFNSVVGSFILLTPIAITFFLWYTNLHLKGTPSEWKLRYYLIAFVMLLGLLCFLWLSTIIAYIIKKSNLKKT